MEALEVMKRLSRVGVLCVLVLGAALSSCSSSNPEPGTTPSTGLEPGTIPGTEPGTDSDVDPGTDPGIGPGTDPGTGPGTDPGTGPGTDPGTGVDPKKTFAVSFDRNGGDTEANPRTLTVTEPATTTGTLPTPPARTGYRFVGWNTGSDGKGMPFDETTIVSAQLTVYAQWVPHSFTVTFDRNDGTTSASPQTITVTRPATTVGTLPASPTRSDYSFGGWNTAADESGTSFTASTTVNADITVYAKWVLLSRSTVSFNRNNDDFDGTEANPQTLTVTEPATTVGQLPAEPKRANHKFAGWFTTPNGGTRFDENTIVSNNLTVYALWLPLDKFTVSFNKNNNDFDGTEANPRTLTVTEPATTTGTLPTPPARTDHRFVGWNTGSGGNGIPFDENTTVSAQLTVYAQWVPLDKFTVSFDRNNDDFDGTEANPRTLTVTEPATTTGTLPTPPARTGYRFVGWSDGNGILFDETTIVSDHLTVYAQWVPLYEFTVSFDRNNDDFDGTEANPRTLTVTEPATTTGTLPTPPARTGYRFVEWNTAADGNGNTFDADTSLVNNLTVFAYWVKLPPGALYSMIHNPITSETPLTPIVDGTYSERSDTFTVKVDGFLSDADAAHVELDIDYPRGLLLSYTSVIEEGIKTFVVTAAYDGQTVFPEGFATIQLNGLRHIPAGHHYTDGILTIRVAIRDGQEKIPARVILVNEDNIQAFNNYARTPAGLTRHYRLSENVTLPPPAGGSRSNWVPIGDNSGSNSQFTGSFDGGGHTLTDLTIVAASLNHQGMFGYVSKGAVIENLGLIGVSVSGRYYVGGLVGYNSSSTVRNCYATSRISGYSTIGSVSGYSNVGGLVGTNFNSTVENSYATVRVTGTYQCVGGLVGSNSSSGSQSSTVQNSYATGNVDGGDGARGSGKVGGLVGENSSGSGNSMVQNSYATGNVNGGGSGSIGSNDIGGLVGENYASGSSSRSTVQNSYATGSVVATNGYYVGGLVGRTYSSSSARCVVQYNMALNRRVDGSSYVGRVVGENHISEVSYNFAFVGMSHTIVNWSTYNKDGTDRSAEALSTREGFPSQLTTSPWTYQQGNLPGLFGATVPRPVHLR